MSKKTNQQYNQVINQCKEVFFNKTQDYGTSWRILRLSSITDKIFIKAKRIRNIQINKEQAIEEGITPEFIGIVNYSIIALIQIKLDGKNTTTFEKKPPEIEQSRLTSLYQEITNQAHQLMEAKNHDYGEAWRDMRVSSLTDLILMRIFRIKKIEENQGKTIASEGIESNYYDIMNYAIFALIKLQEKHEGAVNH